ncbi:MAG: hypothetical protein NT122_09595 [Solirubrobacterales bacterium]|nr:hypothetical protein [Solirubrobacterales bacterium]
MIKKLKYLMPVLAVVVVASGCGSKTTTDTVTSTSTDTVSTESVSTVTQSQAASGPACTNAAVLPVAQAWAKTQNSTVGQITTLQCSGDWGAAVITLGSASEQTDVNIVLKSNGSDWTVQNRQQVCAKPSPVPASLQAIACNSN